MIPAGRSFHGYRWLFRRIAVLFALIGVLSGFIIGGLEAASMLALIGYFIGKIAHSLSRIFMSTN